VLKQPANVRQLPPICDGLTIIVQGYILPNANTSVFSWGLFSLVEKSRVLVGAYAMAHLGFCEES